MNGSGAALSASEARIQALASRKSLAADEVVRRSQAAIDRFRAGRGLSIFRGLSVALYQALPSELDLSELERELELAGVRLLFPRMVPSAAREIEFVALSSRDALWQEGPYGVREPHFRLPAVDPLSIGLIFVPGSAFGRAGERVGMGRGYYDRFLARVPGLVRVALAYDFQLFDRIATSPWDQPVDWIVTESREVRLPRAEQWLEARKAESR